MIKLIGSTEIKITNDKNGESVPHLSLLDVINVWHLMTVPQTKIQMITYSIAHSESFHFKAVTKWRILDAGNAKNLEITVLYNA